MTSCQSSGKAGTTMESTVVSMVSSQNITISKSNTEMKCQFANHFRFANQFQNGERR